MYIENYNDRTKRPSESISVFVEQKLKCRNENSDDAQNITESRACVLMCALWLRNSHIRIRRFIYVSFINVQKDFAVFIHIETCRGRVHVHFSTSK